MRASEKIDNNSELKKFMIRKARPADAERVAQLLGELGYPNSEKFVQNKISILSRRGDDTVLVAESEGIVVGMVHLHIAELFHEIGRLGRVMAIVVDECCRRSGVGKELIESAENLAKDAGCIKMELTCGTHRDDAHRFYGKMGYSEKSKRFVKMLR